MLPESHRSHSDQWQGTVSLRPVSASRADLATSMLKVLVLITDENAGGIRSYFNAQANL